MGQPRVKLRLQGRLKLFINDVESSQPLDVDLHSQELDLNAMIDEGTFRLDENGAAILQLNTFKITLRITDAGEILAGPSVALVKEIEQELSR